MNSKEEVVVLIGLFWFILVLLLFVVLPPRGLSPPSIQTLSVARGSVAEKGTAQKVDSVPVGGGMSQLRQG